MSSFPYIVPVQMPCEHWNHFPVSSAIATMGSVSGSPPPTPEQMPYCKLCRAISIHEGRPIKAKITHMML